MTTPLLESELSFPDQSPWTVAASTASAQIEESRRYPSHEARLPDDRSDARQKKNRYRPDEGGLLSGKGRSRTGPRRQDRAKGGISPLNLPKMGNCGAVVVAPWRRGGYDKLSHLPFERLSNNVPATGQAALQPTFMLLG